MRGGKNRVLPKYKQRICPQNHVSCIPHYHPQQEIVVTQIHLGPRAEAIQPISVLARCEGHCDVEFTPICTVHTL